MSTAPADEILRNSPGTRACMLGNLAIVRGALEAGVQFFSCYPGTPASEVGDTFARIADGAQVTFEYSINEKIAVEIAFAASLAGARAMCGMKHLGLSYACDPCSTMPYVGVEGGMVIVSAGDPSAITSPNEQDQRHLSRFLFYPIFDPATPADACSMTRFAFELSEQTRLPVIMRPTTRVCHSSGMVELGPLPEQRNVVRFTKNPARYTPIPVNARRMRGELSARFKSAEQLLASSACFPCIGQGRLGIVASGVAYAYAAQVVDELDLHAQVRLQQIGAYPIPEQILARFLDTVDAVLVVEELTPFVEDAVSLCAFRRQQRIPVLGKHSGHLPLEFEYSPDLVEDAVRAFAKLKPRPRVSVPAPPLPPRPPVLCPGCPHRTTYYLARRIFGKQTVYCNDIGCYTLGYGEPLQSCDMLLCMGASISQASGIARMTGRRTVAYIGDSTFFHSGIPPLLNALRAGDDVTVIVLDNGITAMTGFQPSLTTPQVDAATDAPGRPRFSVEDAARGLGVRQVYAVDPFDEEPALAALAQAAKGDGVNVVVAHAPCVVNRRRTAGDLQRPPLTIDQELCNGCSLCIRVLGCPGILITDGKYVIDENLCDGCGVCAHVCQHGAIHPIAEEERA